MILLVTYMSIKKERSYLKKEIEIYELSDEDFKIITQQPLISNLL